MSILVEMELIPSIGRKSRIAIGFTLAELLIALGILGVIATFTIPKVLQSQQDGKYNAMAKEVISTVSGAYQAYRLQNGSVPASMVPSDLTPYINYVAVDTKTHIDLEGTITGGDYDCSATNLVCVKLHNGGMLLFGDWDDWGSFGGTASTNAVYFVFDPDGRVTGSNSGKSLPVWLLYNGRICFGDTDTLVSANGTWPPDPNGIPTWFSL